MKCRVTAQCVNSGCVAATSDGTCDCVKVIFIQYDRTVAVCLLTVRVTVLR